MTERSEILYVLLSERIDHTIKKLKTQTANILTLTNLSLGGFAILFAIRDQLSLSLLLIFIAALADRFDGIAARKFNIESDLGKQLDSMSDIISFGVAPALLIYQGILFEFGVPGMFFTVLYLGCGAFRLAKFNISESKGYFVGLPITAAGCFLTLSFLAAPYWPAHVYMFIVLILALLMIGTFRLKKV
jgi:CDP-diacylglycerol--serine O-phosphatidyltransferase